MERSDPLEALRNQVKLLSQKTIQSKEFKKLLIDLNRIFSQANRVDWKTVSELLFQQLTMVTTSVAEALKSGRTLVEENHQELLGTVEEEISRLLPPLGDTITQAILTTRELKRAEMPPIIDDIVSKIESHPLLNRADTGDQRRAVEQLVEDHDCINWKNVSPDMVKASGDILFKVEQAMDALEFILRNAKSQPNEGRALRGVDTALQIAEHNAANQLHDCITRAKHNAATIILRSALPQQVPAAETPSNENAELQRKRIELQEREAQLRRDELETQERRRLAELELQERKRQLDEQSARAAAQGVNIHADSFKELCSADAKQAESWRKVFLVTAGLAVFYFILATHCLAQPATEKMTKEMLAHEILPRALMVIIFMFVLSWASRNFRAARHNHTLNSQRAASVQSFDSLVAATSGSPELQREVVKMVAGSIFNQQATGYLPEAEEKSVKRNETLLDEIAKRLPSLSKGGKE